MFVIITIRMKIRISLDITSSEGKSAFIIFSVVLCAKPCCK